MSMINGVQYNSARRPEPTDSGSTNIVETVGRGFEVGHQIGTAIKNRKLEKGRKDFINELLDMKPGDKLNKQTMKRGVEFGFMPDETTMIAGTSASGANVMREVQMLKQVAPVVGNVLFSLQNVPPEQRGAIFEQEMNRIDPGGELAGLLGHLLQGPGNFDDDGLKASLMRLENMQQAGEQTEHRYAQQLEDQKFNNDKKLIELRGVEARKLERVKNAGKEKGPAEKVNLAKALHKQYGGEITAWLVITTGSDDDIAELTTEQLGTFGQQEGAGGGAESPQRAQLTDSSGKPIGSPEWVANGAPSISDWEE